MQSKFLREMLLFFYFSSIVISWHTTGHFITARIAEIELQQKNPELLEKLTNIIKLLSNFTKESEHPFVEGACFPDDIKYLSWKIYNKWHFYDEPVYAKGFHPASEPVEDKQNLVWAIEKNIRSIQNTNASPISDFLGKSFSLRYLIHFVGDIHQPLHNAAFYSDQFPKGDVGGNAFKIVYPGSDGNLHAFWDKTLKVYGDLKAPLGANDWKKLNDYCSELMTLFPRKKLAQRLKIKNIKDWQEEGHTIAVNNVYKNIQPDTEVSEDYVRDNTPIVKEQLAIAGYRLADLLIESFNNPEMLKNHQNPKLAHKMNDESDELLLTVTDTEGETNINKKKSLKKKNKLIL
jgi:hypothetical protein